MDLYGSVQLWVAECAVDIALDLTGSSIHMQRERELISRLLRELLAMVEDPEADLSEVTYLLAGC